MFSDVAVAVGVTSIIGILRNHEDDAEDNVHQEMNLNFTYESRDTQKSFNLFITVRAITELNLGHIDKLKKKN